MNLCSDWMKKLFGWVPKFDILYKRMNNKKNIISFSLWGEEPKYWIGALRNIELARKFYPGWQTRFYIDERCDSKLSKTLQSQEVEIVNVNVNSLPNYYNGYSGSFAGMFWRFWASEDPDVDVFLSRDTDSRISQREASAVFEWLESDKDFHIMRDHPYHNAKIMGGMWGLRNDLGKKLELSEKIKSWTSIPRTRFVNGIDQDFLAEVIYPLVRDNSYEHSEFGINFGSKTNIFPTQRLNYEFVGDSFDEFDIRHQDYWKVIQKIR